MVTKMKNKHSDGLIYGALMTCMMVSAFESCTNLATRAAHFMERDKKEQLIIQEKLERLEKFEQLLDSSYTFAEPITRVIENDSVKLIYEITADTIVAIPVTDLQILGFKTNATNVDDSQLYNDEDKPFYEFPLPHRDTIYYGSKKLNLTPPKKLFNYP
jgi:hypothetical protein